MKGGGFRPKMGPSHFKITKGHRKWKFDRIPITSY